MRTPLETLRLQPIVLTALTLASLLFPSAAVAQTNEGKAEIPSLEISESDAGLELSIDIDTAWALLLRSLEPVASGELLQRPNDGWLQVHDIWVTAEPVPWRSGTWTRLKVRVGSFTTDLERARAEALLNTVQALWAARQAAELPRSTTGYASYRSSSYSGGGSAVDSSYYEAPAAAVVNPVYNTIYYGSAWCSPMLWYGPTWWSSSYTAYGYYPGSYVSFGYGWNDWQIGVGGHTTLATCGHYHPYGYTGCNTSYAYGHHSYSYYDPWWNYGHGYHDDSHGHHDHDGHHDGHHDDYDGDDDHDGDGHGSDDGEGSKGGGDKGRGDGRGRGRDPGLDPVPGTPRVARRLTDIAKGSVSYTTSLTRGGSSSRTTSPRPAGTITISSGGKTRTIQSHGGRSISLPSLTRSGTAARTSGRVYNLPVGSVAGRSPNSRNLPTVSRGSTGPLGGTSRSFGLTTTTATRSSSRGIVTSRPSTASGRTGSSFGSSSGSRSAPSVRSPAPRRAPVSRPRTTSSPRTSSPRTTSSRSSVSSRSHSASRSSSSSRSGSSSSSRGRSSGRR